MLLAVPCKQGKLLITEDGFLRVQAPFQKVVWQTPCQAVTQFTIQPGAMLALNVTIHTRQQGIFMVEMITKANVEKLQALFPGLHTQQAGKEWYHNPSAMAHVATYTNQKQMQKEVEVASQYGWVPQTSAGIAGHINVGRTATAAALTGGVSLLFGASRTKDKVTMTFVRSQEWLAQRRG